ERVGEDVDRVTQLAERVEHAVARREAFEDLVDGGRRGDVHAGTVPVGVATVAGVTDVPTLTLHELADGVWVWLQPGGESGVSNAGVMADDDGLTVVDTLMVRSQWEPFAAAVAALGAPIRRLVLTHAHVDHVGGTKAFPNAMVLGSPQTSELLDGQMPIPAYKAFMPAFDDEFDELAEIGTRPVTHVVTDAAQLTPRIEVLPATGHTEGDLM